MNTIELSIKIVSTLIFNLLLNKEPLVLVLSMQIL